MRKKQLRQELEIAQQRIAKLHAEVDLNTAVIKNLQRANETLDCENESLYVDLDRAERDVGVLEGTNSALQAANQRFARKQESQEELFGEALRTMAERTGPRRPNRKKLSHQEVLDIRAAYRGGMKQKDLARNYEVNPATISRTVRGIYH